MAIFLLAPPEGARWVHLPGSRGPCSDTSAGDFPEVSEQGPLLPGRCTQRAPSGGARRKIAVGGGKGSTPTVETDPSEN